MLTTPHDLMGLLSGCGGGPRPADCGSVSEPGWAVFDGICGELRMASLICKSKSQRFHTFAGILRCKLRI